MILTAARTAEVIGARWNEFDLAAKVWTVPEDRMKGGRAHRVPLSPAAMKVLEALDLVRGSDADYVFPGDQRKRLSNMAMEMCLRRMGRDEITVHGFRSTFKDWARERSNFQREIVEAALAHVVGDETEAAYIRGDAIEKRRQVMTAWAAFCAKPAVSASVTPIRLASSS